MRLAVSKDLKKIDKIEVFPTPQKFREAMALFHSMANGLSEGKRFTAAAGGIAGPLDHKQTTVLAGHLKDWKDKPLKKSLETSLHCPVYLENDAALAGLGEAVAGAGKGKKVVAYLTFSTGIGGAKIVDRKIDENAFGFEPHRQLVGYPKAKMLGELISGRALAKAGHAPAKDIADKATWKKFSDLAFAGINNAVVFWSPDIMVIGGGIGLSPHLDIKAVQAHINRTFSKLAATPRVVKAKLKDYSGLYGAMEILKLKIKH